MDQQPDPRAPEAPLVPRPSVVTSSGGAGFDTSISGAPPFHALPGAGQPYGQAPLPGAQRGVARSFSAAPPFQSLPGAGQPSGQAPLPGSKPPPGYYYPPQPIYV